MEGAKRLDNLYDDEDQMRKEEINKIAGPNEFTEFYSRLRQIKEFHRIRPEDVAKPLSFEFEQMNIMVRQNEDLPSKFFAKKIYVCSYIFDFSSKFLLLVKISIFLQNVDFFENFDLLKISI